MYLYVFLTLPVFVSDGFFADEEGRIEIGMQSQKFKRLGQQSRLGEFYFDSPCIW